VVVDPVLVRVVLREVAGGDPAGGEAPPSSRRLPLIMSPVRAASVIAPYSHLIAPYSRPAANGPHELSVQLQIPKLGVTVWDDAPRELLCLSLRGLRFARNCPTDLDCAGCAKFGTRVSQWAPNTGRDATGRARGWGRGGSRRGG